MNHYLRLDPFFVPTDQSKKESPDRAFGPVHLLLDRATPQGKIEGTHISWTAVIENVVAQPAFFFKKISN